MGAPGVLDQVSEGDLSSQVQPYQDRHCLDQEEGHLVGVWREGGRGEGEDVGGRGGRGREREEGVGAEEASSSLDTGRLRFIIGTLEAQCTRVGSLVAVGC